VLLPLIANGAAFAKGRDFAAWLGLVPKQMSTGDRTILGRISKRGNRYLRTLFMRGARVILLRPKNWTRYSFGPWLTAAAKRLHRNVLATALANKLARIAWTVLAQRRNYETRVMPEQGKIESFELVGNVGQNAAQTFAATPSLKATMHCFVIRIALRQHMPLRAGVEYPERSLKNMTRRDRPAAGSSVRNVLFGKVMPNPFPLKIAQPNHSALIADRQQLRILR
jgi:hypothetical protein